MKPIDAGKTSQFLVEFMRKTFQKSGFSKAVIALSGGLDSSVSCTLAARALSKEDIFPVLMPYGMLNREGVEDAIAVINFLGILKENVTQIDIKSFADEIFKTDSQMDDVRKGNIMARLRMILLFDQAKKHKAMVVGTENKSEHLLGYFTRFGDEASDIEPLSNLYKTHVYDLGKSLGLPKSVLTKKPTAGLWENQTDEGEFGFLYKDADQILYWHFDEKMSEEQIVKKGLEKDVVRKVLEFAKKNSFKHHLPFILEV